MKRFYAGIGTGKRTSLREAQLATKKAYPHPFFWGAFQLIGLAEN